jgi:BirA family biotin operon repressor/biotin-[acetyl-CoA-carboxylase] ligase
MSVLLRPEDGTTGQLLMMAALAASRTVDAMAGVRATVKWPNDVRVEGRKVCGVIAESEVGPNGIVAVLGIGLNVNSTPDEWPGIEDETTSLRLLAGREVARSSVEQVLLDELDSLYVRIREGGSVREDWAARLDTLGSDVEVTRHPGQERTEITGRAESVDEMGRLLVRDATGRVWRLAAGEVTLRVESPSGSRKAH